MKSNVELNQLRQVKIEKMAIGNSEDSIALYYNENEKNSGMVTTISDVYSLEEKVRMTKLDNYVREQNITKIDFIKIDIEGAEYLALLGMEQTLMQYKPMLMIEILEQNNSENARKIELFLKQLNYKKYFIDDDGKLSSTNQNISRNNYIFSVYELLAAT